MTDTNMDHRTIALRLLTDVPTLSHKEGGFLGHMVVADVPTEKQRNWLTILAERHNIGEAGHE